MGSCHIAKTVRELAVGDHVCGVYRTEEERRDFVLPYLHHGLLKDQRVVHIAERAANNAVVRGLAAGGIDVERYVAAGQLVLSGFEDVYLRGGSFDPATMKGLLLSAIRQVRARKFAALRVVGEMSWILKGLPGSHRWFEYECGLADVFADQPILGLCLYDERAFPPGSLRLAVDAHSIILRAPVHAGQVA